MAPRDRFYTDLAIGGDQALADAFERITDGDPNAKVDVDGARALLEQLLSDDAITESEARTMKDILDYALEKQTFTDPALQLIGEKLHNAIDNDALIKGARPIPPNSNTMNDFSVHLGLQ